MTSGNCSDAICRLKVCNVSQTIRPLGCRPSSPEHESNRTRHHDSYTTSGDTILYTQAVGHFNLNVFIKKDDGTIASESTVGRFTFSADKYCEWIIYTIRKDLDKAGVTNEAPPVGNHCSLVTSKDGRFNFSPPGEGVEVSYGAEGFTASIGGDFLDHRTKIE